MNMINFKCDECSKPIQVSIEMAGKQGKCPHCQSLLIVPAPMVFDIDETDAPDVKQSWAEYPAKVDLPMQPAGPKSVPLADKAKSFIGTFLYWIFGLLFALWTLGVIFEEPLAAIPLMVATVLLLPPLCDMLMAKFQFDLQPPVRAISAVVLGVAGMLLFSNHMSDEITVQNTAAESAAAQKKVEQKKANTDYLVANKPAIIAQFQQLLDAKKISEAKNLLQKYNGLGDSDVDAMFAKVDAKAKDIARDEQTASLKAKLAQLGKDDYAGQETTYKALLALYPGNKEYTDKLAAASHEIKKASEFQQRRIAGEAWEYETMQDSMSQKPVTTAFIKSTNRLSFDFPYRGAQQAMLQLRKHPRWGQDVILHIQKGQFLCNSYDGCDVSVRFGNGKPKRFSAGEPSDNDSTYIFIRGYNSFVSELRKVDKVYIEAQFYQEGAQTIEFAVDGLDWK
jgi:DNA-directed RNA polymerase subunit RPC12/RpoP